MANQIEALNARIEALTVERSPLPQPSQTIPLAPPQPLLIAPSPPTPPRPAMELPTVPINLPGHNLNVAAAIRSMDTASPPVLPAFNTNESESVDKLVIGHGQVVTYRYSNVRQPPQISFAGKIPCLSRVWDDEHPSWDPVDCTNNLLEINGTAIALRYWPDGWNEWKYVAERFHLSGEDAFWDEFSYKDSNNKNHREGWAVITKRLRTQRDESERQLVEQAKAEYGAQFGKVFVNNRGSQLTDQSAIARRYLEELAKRS
ncbi:hypothetical protein EV361DRAFT_956140 [Lentinula raphanica]|nr:hypothetical protein EV361DRAFT_956140 [Lentinula raphanica]